MTFLHVPLRSLKTQNQATTTCGICPATVGWFRLPYIIGLIKLQPVYAIICVETSGCASGLEWIPRVVILDLVLTHFVRSDSYGLHATT